MSLTFFLLLIVVFCFAIGALLGAPFLPTRRAEIKIALELLDLKPGQRVLDLGCGHGSFLKAAAREGLSGVGYEINPLMYLAAKLNTRACRDKVEIRFQNYWQVTLPPADGIYVFLITRYMAKLDHKLQKEVNRPLRVVSYTFEIPGKQALETKDGVYLYRYK